MIRSIALLAFVAAIAAGTITDVPRRTAPDSPRSLIGDFHVHAMPGDGFLPVWEIQREAERRGVDVLAITNHNHRLALAIGERLGLMADYPIVMQGQEVTTGTFHMAAVGITRMIGHKLTARQALEAIHAQGGVGIAAHPFAKSWIDTDEEALRLLDGAEVAHPAATLRDAWGLELRAFAERARRFNPNLAEIGSSDFHAGPMGRFGTRLEVDAPTRDGVLDAIRRGRTTALGHDAGSRTSSSFGYGLPSWIAVMALASLAVAVARS